MPFYTFDSCKDFSFGEYVIVRAVVAWNNPVEVHLCNTQRSINSNFNGTSEPGLTYLVLTT